MVPVISEIFGAITFLVVGVACVRELIDSGCRLDLLLLAAVSFAIIPFLLRRAYQTVKEIRALVDGDQ
jgi:hypothetical protein